MAQKTLKECIIELLDKTDQLKSVETILDTKNKEYEDDTQITRALRDDLQAIVEELRKQITETLEAEKITSVKEGNSTITRQQKVTNKIKDVFELFQSIGANKEKFIEYGVDVEEVMKSFKPTVEMTNKELVEEAVKKFRDIEGNNLDGIEEKITNFITIKKD